jgi:hypothetical protein
MSQPTRTDDMLRAIARVLAKELRAALKRRGYRAVARSGRSGWRVAIYREGESQPVDFFAVESEGVRDMLPIGARHWGDSVVYRYENPRQIELVIRAAHHHLDILRRRAWRDLLG